MMLSPWLSAFRLRTLPLAASGVITGSALAAFHHGFRWPVFGLALLTAILLQVLGDLANDLGDHARGTDNDGRLGPHRALQSGAISRSAMKRAMLICAALALASGVCLLLVALGSAAETFAFFLIGLLAIAAAVKYTYGRKPYGYAGFGDISVLLFFGLAGVAGTFYLHTGTLGCSIFLPATGLGLLAAGVLNVNNMRDIENDAASGKHTLAVRLGAGKARIYHAGLVLAGSGLLIAFTAWSGRSAWQWIFLPVLAVPLLHLIRVFRANGPHALDPQLKVLALGTFAVALAFSLGLILA